jgi:O-antigen/teichoic acid export membrane protein
VTGLAETQPTAPSAAGEGERGSSLAVKLVMALSLQAAAALLLLLTTPLLLALMGAEAYALVAFATVLQAWMTLFDLGVAALLARQLTRYRAGALSAGDARNLTHACERLYLGGGLMALVVFLFASPWIAARWLGHGALAPAEIALSLRLVAALLVLRWMGGLYQSALVGLERQTLANAVTLAGAAARILAGFAVLLFVSRAPSAFFTAQVALMLAEVLFCRWMLSRSIAAGADAGRSGWALLADQWRFAVGIIVSASAATVIGQADKLTLSHALSLAQFGIFGLVVSICTGIAMIVPPFVQAFQPRLTLLHAQDRSAEFAHVYRLAAAVSLVLAAALAGTIAAHPDWTVFAWTGRRDIAAALAPVLTLYAAGAGFAAFQFTPFVLQYAQGTVRLHVIGNVLFAAIMAPLAVWAALAHGALGAGVVWLAGNFLFVAIWTPIIHARLLAREARRGLDLSLWVRLAALAAFLAATRYLPVAGVSRLGALALLAGLSLAVAALGIGLSRELRQHARRVLGL